MATTRDFNSLGIWADDAETVIPMTPVEGVAYRNDTLTPSENEAGEGFDTKPDSADFNQKMFIITSFIDEMDKHGIVGWSDEVDYEVPAITWGDNGIFYTALQDSGPAGVGPKDPSTPNPAFWEQIFGSSSFELDLTSQVHGDEGARLVGTTYQPDPSLPIVGQTVQDSLITVDKQSYRLHGLSLALSGRFDIDGILISNGFNILNNIAEKVEMSGMKYYRIFLGSQFLSPVVLEDLHVSVNANTALLASSVGTANEFIYKGSWVLADGEVIDDTNSIKIQFVDPLNPNVQIFTPFSVTVTFPQTIAGNTTT